MQTNPEFIQSILVGIIVIVALAGGLVWLCERIDDIWRGREK